MNDSLNDMLFLNEVVFWKGKPNKFCYVLSKFGKLLPAAILFLIFDGFFIWTMVSSGAMYDVFSFFVIFIVIFFAIHLFPVWLCIGKIFSGILEHKNVVYAVTSHRIIIRNGIVGLDFQGLDYADISNVQVNVSIIERLFKVGTVIISTSSGRSLCLFAVTDPYKLYKKINKLFIDIKSDIHYPNAYRPEENPGYNSRYTGE